jgi:preflagellin peptidase FlaK
MISLFQKRVSYNILVSYLYEWLEYVRMILSLLFLSYASWQDYKSREVSDIVWGLFAPLGLALTLLNIFLVGDYFLFTILFLSFLLVAGINIFLFYIGFFGGADVKAFICLSIAFPFQPTFLQPGLGIVSPLYTMSIFSNAVLISSLTAVGIFLYNVLLYFVKSESFFEGLDQESIFKKMLILFTGYKIQISELRRRPYLVPLEVFSREENGEITRSLKLFVRTDVEPESSIAEIESFFGSHSQKVWVTPFLPYIVFITVGFIVTLFVGDIIFWVITRILWIR